MAAGSSSKFRRYMIVAGNGILWESNRWDAYEEGTSILNAVQEGNVKGYIEHIGQEWQGELAFVKELARPAPRLAQRC